MSTLNIVKIQASDGSQVEFDDQIIGSGGMKDVFFSPDKKYVVAFYRSPQDMHAKDRLENIVGRYKDDIFNREGGEYWEKLFCWPTKIVEHKGKLGLVAPTYDDSFFFKYGSANNDMFKIKGKEKEGKWFASASHQNKTLDPREKGDWLSYFRISILISRAVRRLHAAGLAHSDLSYKNVLIDPSGRNACIIDIDGLVVPGKYLPDVVGTPDFIAPEVIATRGLSKGDPTKCLPSIYTDRHALSVLIYMYLLYRHPLRGGKVHHLEAEIDEELSMGEKALFVEHPNDKSNIPNLDHVRKSYLPWADINKISYSVTGPYLQELFDRSFIQSIHNPHQRPTADDWEQALVKTIDLIQPCNNPSCHQKWFVFDNTVKPVCPFCKISYKRPLPVLNLYSSRHGGKFISDKHRLMVYHNQYLYPWHVNRNIFPNEKLKEKDKKAVGYFVFHQGEWIFVNQTLTGAKDLNEDKSIPINSMVKLEDGKKILLSPEDGGRLVHVQLVNS